MAMASIITRNLMVRHTKTTRFMMQKLLPSSSSSMIHGVAGSSSSAGDSDSTRMAASKSSFFTDNQYIGPALSLAREVFMKAFLGNYRSKRELEFQSMKTEEGFHLFLNVCGCSANELVVQLEGDQVHVRGEGKALSDELKVVKESTDLLKDIRYDPCKVKGFVQKGRLLIFFPSTDKEIKVDKARKQTVDCVDLPLYGKKAETKGERPRMDELGFDFLLVAKKLAAPAAMRMLVRAWLHIPAKLDFQTEFNAEGLNVFLNVCGCAAKELQVTLVKRTLRVVGDGDSMAGTRAKIKMTLDFPSNFRFDPAQVKGYVLKGELYVLLSYSKEWIDLDPTTTHTIPLIDV